jgi:hypothetical protein
LCADGNADAAKATPGVPAWEHSEVLKGCQRLLSVEPSPAAATTPNLLGSSTGAGPPPAHLPDAQKQGAPPPAAAVAAATEASVPQAESVVTAGPLDGVKRLLLWTDPGASALAFVLGLVALRRGIDIAPVRALGNPERETARRTEIERERTPRATPASVQRTAYV